MMLYDTMHDDLKIDLKKFKLFFKNMLPKELFYIFEYFCISNVIFVTENVQCQPPTTWTPKWMQQFPREW